jgi:hypothetical protein
MIDCPLKLLDAGFSVLQESQMCVGEYPPVSQQQRAALTESVGILCNLEASRPDVLATPLGYRFFFFFSRCTGNGVGKHNLYTKSTTIIFQDFITIVDQFIVF